MTDGNNEDPEIRAQWLPWLAASLGLVLSIGLWRVFENHEQSQVRARFEQDVQERVAAIEFQLEEELNAVYALKAFFDGSQHVDRAEFRAFTDSIIERHHALKGFVWVEHVTDGKRGAHEAAVREEGLLDYRIARMDTEGLLDSTLASNEYFPLVYVEPLERAPVLLGLDVSSIPEIRELIARLSQGGTFLLSGPVKSWPESAGELDSDLIALLKVYSNLTEPESRSTPAGYVGALLSSREILKAAISHIAVEGINLELTDVTVPGREQLFGRLQSRTLAGDLDTETKNSEFELGAIGFIKASGRRWQVRGIATPAYGETMRSMTPVIASTSGLICTLVLTVYFALLKRRARVVEETIERRTQELNSAARHVEEQSKLITSIHDAVIDGLITIDEHGTIEDANQAVENVFGYRIGEVLGKNVSMLMPEPYASAHDGYLRRYMETGVARIIGSGREVQGRRKDSTVFPLELSISEARSESKRVFVGLVRDISERKRAERERAEALAFQRAILQSADYSVIATDPDGTIRVFNAAAERMLGYRADDMVGKQTPQIIHDANEVAERARALSAEAGETIEPGFDVFVSKARSGITEEREWTYIRKDGTRFPVSLSVTPVLDDDDEIIAFLGIAADITERKAAAEALRESEERYRDLFENTADLIQSVGPDGEFQYVNAAWNEALGYDHKDLRRLTMQDVVAASDLPHCTELLQRIFSGEDVGLVETTFVAKDGREVPVEGHISCRFENGKPVATRGIFRDVSARREIEKMKREFISTVSHELRTPLTSIHGSLDLVNTGAAGEVPEAATKMLKIAEKNCERLIRLINDILDTEKLESGRMDFQMAEVDAVEITKATLAANRGLGEKFDVTIVLAEAPDHAPIRGDKDRLEQALTNLISNAVKYSHKGGTVRVSIVENGTGYRFSVKDEGDGIPPEFQERIFKKFEQADSSDKRALQGTGLGLHITKLIVEAHGGNIRFKTHKGKGTTFYFELQRLMREEQRNSSPAVIGSPKILICEDDPDIAALLEMTMQQAGYDTDIVSTGAALRMALEHGDYVALTLDLMLPDADGFSVIDELRREGKHENLPVVVVSANADSRKAEVNGDALFIQDWISKPINRDRLLSAIRQATHAGQDRLPRVLHVEDDIDLRVVIEELVGESMELVPARSIADASQHIQSGEQFDLVLLDLGLPDGDGAELLPLVRQQLGAGVPIVVFSADDAPSAVARQVARSLTKSRHDIREVVGVIQDIVEGKKIS